MRMRFHVMYALSFTAVLRDLKKSDILTANVGVFTQQFDSLKCSVYALISPWATVGVGTLKGLFLCQGGSCCTK